MAITAAQYERISQFLEADMDLATLHEFEIELVANPEMRQQLDFELFVRDGLAPTGPTNKNVVAGQPTNSADVFVKGKAITKNLVSTRWLVTGFAASFILAISILLLFNQQTKNITPSATLKATDRQSSLKDISPSEITKADSDSTKLLAEWRLFKKYYVKDKIPDEYPIFLADAFIRYKGDDYTALQRLNLSDLPDTRGSNSSEEKFNILRMAHYYTGISYLETGQTEIAITHFNWVMNNHPAKGAWTKAAWFIALAYLKMNEAQSAKELLLKIQRNGQGEPFVSNAGKLLNALEKDR